MEKFNCELEEELALLEKYNLTPTELFVSKLLLIALEEGDNGYIIKYLSINDIGSFRDILISLQDKGIILKSYKIPEKGKKFVIEDVEFNKNFSKTLHKASFELGKELYEAFPQTTVVKGQVFNLRRVSKRFNSLEEAFFKYGKYIRFNSETHKEILDLIKWGIDNMYSFTTLDSFIIDKDWNNIKNIKDNNGININYDTVKML